MKIYSILGWLSLIVVASYAMFHISYEVEKVESKLQVLNRQSLSEQEGIHVLKAEWSHLNRPENLRVLSQELLPHMRPPAINQIGTLDQLPEREGDGDHPASVAEIERR
jgi:cell division protein FtsL